MEYRYALEHDGNTIGYEEGDPRLIPCPKAGAVVEVHDEWRVRSRVVVHPTCFA